MRLLRNPTTSTASTTASSSPPVVSLRINRKRHDADEMYYRAVVTDSPDWDMLIGYSDCQIIGKGSYGEVVSARAPSGVEVAIKRVEILEDNQSSDWENGLRLLREIYFLRSVKHPNLASLVSLFPNNPSSSFFRQIYLISNYFKDGSLTGFSPSTLFDIVSIQHQLLSALSYLHANNVIHRDVKRENIFLLKNGKKIHLVLGDFGLTRTSCKNGMTSEVVTKPYRCPSLLLGETRYGSEIDIFAAGLCLMEMLLGKLHSTILPNRKIGLANFVKHQIAICGPPKSQNGRIWDLAERMHLDLSEIVSMKKNMDFDDRMVIEWKSMIMNDIDENIKRLGGSSKVSEGLKEMCFKMIKFDPTERISAKTALEDSLFSKFTLDLSIEDPELRESFDAEIRPLGSDDDRAFAVKNGIWDFVQKHNFVDKSFTDIFPMEQIPVAKRTRRSHKVIVSSNGNIVVPR